jgi:acyl-CoA thioesterase-1
MLSKAFQCVVALGLVCGLFACTASPSQSPSVDADEQEALATAETLPKVLMIGDSISIGYTRGVKEQLAGVADVSRIPANGEWTGYGLSNIDAWLGHTRWDVIHFNWGLWDMYGWRYKDEDLSPAAYEARLDQLVSRLKQTDATLIWATTTPACPEPEVTMLNQFDTKVVFTPKREQQYLDAARRVMQRHGVRINDLHALMKPDLSRYAVAPDNVHFKPEGRAKLARQVASAIADAIDRDTDRLP